MSLLDLIKETALDVNRTTNPVNIMYGTVIQAKPLTIEVHSKLILTDEFLLVSEHLTRHERIISIQYEHPHNFSQKEIGDDLKSTSSKRKDIGSSYATPYEEYEMKYAKVVFEDGLKDGDKVILHRVQGGQKFYVSDRYKEGDKVWSYPQKT